MTSEKKPVDEKKHKEIEAKRHKEQEVVEEMIRIYCQGVHKTSSLCPACEELLAYTRKRTELCPFMEEKTFCSHCKVHCYQPDKRREIQAVMRYAGPRMLWRRPLLAIAHVYYSCKEKWQAKK